LLGAQLLPKLLLFTASDNCLESFKGLPSLTSLQTLQMSGNVALEGRERLPTAAAMIIGKSLQKFSGQTDKAQLVTKKTFDDTNLFPAYVINFLQMGWCVVRAVIRLCVRMTRGRGGCSGCGWSRTC